MFNAPLFSYTSLLVLLNIAIRYLIFTGTFYLFFYVWKNKKYWAAKIQQHYPENKYIFNEIKNSFISILIFGAVVILVLWAGNKGLTLAYTQLNKHGYIYYIISIILMVVLHDTYFYWTHRLMHWKPIFKIAHKTHHLSTNPTPFAAYAFHPIEAIIEVGIIPLIAFTIPYHVTALLIFTLYSLLVNVIGHLGFELFPKGFATNKIFKWHNTSTHHNMHHKLFKCNYGFYFNFWDRIMRTNHSDYERNFDLVVEKRIKDKVKNKETVILN